MRGKLIHQMAIDAAASGIRPAIRRLYRHHQTSEIQTKGVSRIVHRGPARTEGSKADSGSVDCGFLWRGSNQWLKWFCEAGGGGSPDEARLEQTPYPI